jgi:hypothetical protein
MEMARDRKTGLKDRDKGRDRVKGQGHNHQLGLESWLIRLDHLSGHEVKVRAGGDKRVHKCS